MRTLLSGAVILALLGGLGMAVAVQGQEAEPGSADVAAPAPYAAVTGSASGRATGAPDIVLSPEPPQVQARDYRAMLSVRVDDPRLTGSFETNQNYDQFVENVSGAVRAGTGRLSSDGGTWAATLRGFTPPGASAGMANRYHVLLIGEDGYDGLSAMLFFTPVGMARWEVDGVIFPGPLPEYPDPIPAE